jgi:hypothetical protein
MSIYDLFVGIEAGGGGGVAVDGGGEGSCQDNQRRGLQRSAGIRFLRASAHIGTRHTAASLRERLEIHSTTLLYFDVINLNFVAASGTDCVSTFECTAVH